MRRTVSLVAAAGVLLVLAGPAGAGPGDGPPALVGSGAISAGPEVEPAPEVGDAPAEVGTVEQVGAMLDYLDGDRSITLHYPGAEYVKVQLGRMLLLPGDYVTVADPDRQEVYEYRAVPLPQPDGSGGGDHGGDHGGAGWAMSVTGDTAVVTLHRAAPEALLPDSVAGLGVTVHRVAYGAATPAPAPRTGREESICGRDDSRDAVCYRSSHPAVYQSSKAVARLLINGVQMCTAFRVGPNNRMLTNNHCVSNARDARSTEVWFNYQCAECGGWSVFPPTKVRADRVLATHEVLDYTLFTVDSFAAVQRYGYLRLSDRPVAAGEEIYIPQHPGGEPARVALRSDRDPGGTCRIADPRAHGYGWQTDASYYCDTTGGSSGSPVLSRRTHQVVALHHFGGCPNSGVRTELIAPRIAPLL